MTEPKQITVMFECGQEDRQSAPFGPYEWVQLTYDGLRVSPEDDEFIAYFTGGWWVTPDGQKWSDVIIG